ncbi:hypothetical protein OF83DRAFT_1177956 [Amylostereum chailletii]|nr:hypothetical protein OF83DRAFT_1177956 [Amylostereum chailletii]
MDTSWCLTCSCHLEGDQDVYCSDACYQHENSSSSSFCLPSSSRPPATHPSQWHGTGHDGIRAWANAVPAGPPPSLRSRSSSPDCDRTPSPSARSRTSLSSSSSSLRPKLLDIHHRPLPPSLSLSISSTEMHPSTSRPQSPLPSPPQPIITTPTQRTRAFASQRSSLSCTTAPTATTTESQSLATPVTPAMPIPSANPVKPHHSPKKAIWRQVRGWVAPSSPTPTVHVHQPLVHGLDSNFTVFARTHKHPLALLDEDLLAASGLAKGRDERTHDDDDDDDESRGEDLASWFLAKAHEQRAGKEMDKHKAWSKSKDSGGVKKSAHAGQQQQQPTPAGTRKPARADQTAYFKRGRPLERASAMAHYQAMR